MGKIVAINHVTLDGVMQAPGSAEEDTRDGFEHGGWAVPNNDEVMGRVLGERMSAGGPLLFGRRTYEQFHGYWPQQGDNPFTKVLNKARKYVASTTLTEPLPWENSVLLEGDLATAVREIKRESQADIGILGSGGLIHSLREHDLIDSYLLMIHPVLLGTGRRLFDHGVPSAELRLADSVTTTKGVVIATYERVR
jgi:dihydrofolate reductase